MVLRIGRGKGGGGDVKIGLHCVLNVYFIFLLSKFYVVFNLNGVILLIMLRDIFQKMTAGYLYIIIFIESFILIVLSYF